MEEEIKYCGSCENYGFDDCSRPGIASSTDEVCGRYQEKPTNCKNCARMEFALDMALVWIRGCPLSHHIEEFKCLDKNCKNKHGEQGKKCWKKYFIEMSLQGIPD